MGTGNGHDSHRIARAQASGTCDRTAQQSHAAPSRLDRCEISDRPWFDRAEPKARRRTDQRRIIVTPEDIQLAIAKGHTIRRHRPKRPRYINLSRLTQNQTRRIEQIQIRLGARHP